MPTLTTLAEAEAARPDPACLLMMDANCEPSCSRLTRLATDVLFEKNAVQFAVIAAFAAASDEDDVVELGVAAGVVAAGVVAGGVEAGGLLLPPQAVTTAASAQAPSIAEVCLLVFIQLFSNSLSASGIPRTAVILR